MSYLCVQCKTRFRCKETRSFGSYVLRTYACPTCDRRISTREIIEQIRESDGDIIINTRRREVEMLEGDVWTRCPAHRLTIHRLAKQKQEALERGEEIEVRGIKFRYKQQPKVHIGA